MKKTIALILMFLFLAPSGAFAVENTSIFQIGNTVYKANGIEKSMDTAPFIQNNRTYMPVRYVAYGLGLSDEDITYKDETASFNGRKNVRLSQGVSSMYVDGKLQNIDTPPIIVDSRMFLPVRFVAEAFDAEVKWDAKDKKVTINGDSNKNTQNDNINSKITYSEPPLIVSPTGNSITEICSKLGLEGELRGDLYTVQGSGMNLKFSPKKLVVEYGGGQKEISLKKGLLFGNGDIFVGQEDYVTVMTIVSMASGRVE